ncbi:hypothetical protein BH11PLA2_BH11PLA2_11350 [soil metagenome]
MRKLLLLLLLLPIAALIADPPRNQYHRDGFAGRQPVFMAADSNVSIEEKDHRIVTDRYYNAPSSEYLKFEAKPAAKVVDAEFAHYAYDVPKTPVAPIDGSTAAGSLWVRSFRSGIQLRARVRFPKERDPANPEQELSCLILGESYPEEKVRSWQRLSLGNPAEALQKQLPVLRARLKRELDTSGAYIDRVLLNVYTGPGTCEVWIDDLDIGPCIPEIAKPKGALTANAKQSREQYHPYNVEFAGGRIRIDNKPFFMRAIRWTDCPLKELRDANFNTIVLPGDSTSKTVEEAVQNGYMIVAGVPIATEPGLNENVGTLNVDAEKLAENFRRFRSGDGVLMWDLGMNRKYEDVRSVVRTAESLRSYDARRPRSVNLWDGFSAYSESLNVIGSHRWPLFTDLTLDRYREWLLQRRALSAPGKLHWTWIQAHAPDWYVRLAEAGNNPDVQLVALAPGKTALDPTSPIGPQAEQIRLLTYLSLACGYRGYGIWSDRWLSNSHFGRDRFIETYFLNCEMQLLEPVLFAAEDEKTTWEPTSHPHVKAAVIRGKKGIAVLPVWIGPGSQCVMPQAAVDGLVIKVKLVPEGYDPWVLTPASYENLHSSGKVRQVPGGTEITIPKFDLTSIIVFTNDTAPDGLIVRWQDNIRHTFGKDAARYAREQATEVYAKVTAVHEKLVAAGAPPVKGADDLLLQARQSMRLSAKAFDNAQYDVAFREARAALRPIRVVMHDHWLNAMNSLTCVTSSPYAVGFYTLPQHWELAAKMQAAKPGENLLKYGGFELSETASGDGAAVASLPGWTTRQTSLDGCAMVGSIFTMNAEITGKAKDLGKNCLRLKVTPPKPVNAKNTEPPQALERTALAVTSPLVDAKPGSWVRVSFRASVPKPLEASADGAVVFDTAGGEPLAVRIQHTKDWQRFALYRQVPADGKIGITFALTGLGTAYFDDVRIEPME